MNSFTDLARSGVRIALTRVSVAVARFADAQIDAFISSGVSDVAVLAGESPVTGWTAAFFNLRCSGSSGVELLSHV